MTKIKILSKLTQEMKGSKNNLNLCYHKHYNYKNNTQSLAQIDNKF